MAVETSFVSTRVAIQEALLQAVKDFSSETRAENCQLFLGPGRYQSIEEQGYKAVKDLAFFWRNQNLYSTKANPAYINVRILLLQIGGADHTIREITSLEELWTWFETDNQDTQYNRFLVCDKLSQVESTPMTSSLTPTERIIKNYRSSEAICTSATIACLFLVRRHFNIGAGELYHLLEAVLGNVDYNYGTLLADIPESCLYPVGVRDVTQPRIDGQCSNQAEWYSVKTTSLLPNNFLLPITKTVVFPDTYPPFQTSSFWMDVYQPHGSRPVSTSRCAANGIWNTDRSRWGSILAMGNRDMAETYIRIMSEVISSGKQEILDELSNHWLHPLRYLYILGLNNTRLIIRDTMKIVQNMKYKNAANPTAGAAHVCLMFINHLEYYKHLVSSICTELESCHPEWHVSAMPEWTKSLKAACELLDMELSKVQKETREVRQMIIDQHDLYRSQKTIVLTILAAIFVPMSFVASVFGMNTTEINGSAWSIKYYVIAAVPLTMLTLLVPLFALQAFNFLVRIFQTSALFRSVIKWGWISSTFMLKVVAEVLYFLPPSYPSRAVSSAYSCLLAPFLVHGVFYIPRLLVHIGLYQSKSLLQKEWWRNLYLEYQLWPLIYAVAVIMAVLGVEFPIIGLVPYILYFFIRIRRWRMNRKQ